MAKRKVSTGLKIKNGKTIYIGDVLKFTVTEDTTEDFHNHPLGKVLNALGYNSIYITVQKHKWLELDMTAFVEGKNELLAEKGLVVHIANGNKLEEFDNKYKETAPAIYGEPLMDTTFLRFLLDQNLQVEKCENFDSILARSEDFYMHAIKDIHEINEKEKNIVEAEFEEAV